MHKYWQSLSNSQIRHITGFVNIIPPSSQIWVFLFVIQITKVSLYVNIHICVVVLGYYGCEIPDLLSHLNGVSQYLNKFYIYNHRCIIYRVVHLSHYRSVIWDAKSYRCPVCTIVKERHMLPLQGTYISFFKCHYGSQLFDKLRYRVAGF